MADKFRVAMNAIFVLMALCFAVIWFLSMKVECGVINDPYGKYTAIISCRLYLCFIPMMPGSSGDKPGYVRLVDKEGNDYGEVYVEMINFAKDIRWTDKGPDICGSCFQGEWKLKNK